MTLPDQPDVGHRSIADGKLSTGMLLQIDTSRSPLARSFRNNLSLAYMGFAEAFADNYSSRQTQDMGQMAIWIAAAFIVVLVGGTVFLFARRWDIGGGSESASAPLVQKRGMTRTNTMQSSVSIRSDRSTTSNAGRKRAGKLLSDKCRGRRASAMCEPRARMVSSNSALSPTGTAPTWGGQEEAARGAAAAGSAAYPGIDGLAPGSARSARSARSGAGYAPGDCRFMVPVDTLVEVAEKGSFCITDMASGLLLRISVVEHPDGSRNLQVFVGQDSSTPCTTVGPPRGDMSRSSSDMEIKGANGLHFGMLTLQPNGAFVVTTAEQQPLLIIEGNEANLDLRISARDGRLVAAVSCSQSTPSSGVEHVEFRVLPGTDPVLVISCILSVLLLGGDEDSE